MTNAQIREVARDIIATYDGQVTIVGFINNVVWPPHLDDEYKLNIIWHVIDIMYARMIES